MIVFHVRKHSHVIIDVNAHFMAFRAHAVFRTSVYGFAGILAKLMFFRLSSDGAFRDADRRNIDLVN